MRSVIVEHVIKVLALDFITAKNYTYDYQFDDF